MGKYLTEKSSKVYLLHLPHKISESQILVAVKVLEGTTAFSNAARHWSSKALGLAQCGSSYVQ